MRRPSLQSRESLLEEWMSILCRGEARGLRKSVLIFTPNCQCCTEYGYCHSRVDWESGTYFRDCNGVSNGISLPPNVIDLELQEREQGRESADDELLGILVLLMSLNAI